MNTVRSLCRIAIWIAVACLSSSSPAWAQASITGMVNDELGGAIAGATITVRSAAGAVTQTTTTDAGGAFSIASLPSGRYEITADSPLFPRSHSCSA